MRITLLELALLATPFLLFFLYRAAVGQRTSTGEAVNETPYQILFLAGSALSLAALIAAVLLGRDAPDPSTGSDQVYVPQRVVNGEIVPGHFISREEAIAQGLIAESGRDRDTPAAPEAEQAEPGPSSEAPDT